jgi:hypothetical protein
VRGEEGWKVRSICQYYKQISKKLHTQAKYFKYLLIPLIYFSISILTNLFLLHTFVIQHDLSGILRRRRDQSILLMCSMVGCTGREKICKQGRHGKEGRRGKKERGKEDVVGHRQIALR